MRTEYPHPMNANESREFVDDDADGFKLRIYRANDGDFFISIIPDYGRTFEQKYDSPEEQELFAGLNSASVRIRAPMLGGGSHPALYAALAGMRDKGTTPDECPFCGCKSKHGKPKQ